MTGVQTCALPILVTATLFTMLNNSSQFGLAEAVNLASTGAGYATMAVVTLLSSVVGNRIVKRTDVAEDIRSTV